MSESRLEGRVRIVPPKGKYEGRDNGTTRIVGVNGKRKILGRVKDRRDTSTIITSGVTDEGKTSMIKTHNVVFLILK